MKTKVSIFAIMLMTVSLGIPVEGSAAPTIVRDRTITEGTLPQISVTYGQPRRRRARRGTYWRNGRQYRNYGQYRRTQVGNRRYRLTPRYYWSGGVRRVRYVRYYY